MEQSFGAGATEVVGRHAGARDAQAVGENGHWNRGQGDHHANPGALVDEIAEHESQRKQRHQRSNAAARLGDFELGVRQDEDVAFAKNWNVERADRVFADVRCEQLQRKRDLVEDDRRNRNHQQHERQREQPGREAAAIRTGKGWCPSARRERRRVK